MLVSRAGFFLRTSDDEKEQEKELAKLNLILENDPKKIFARLVIFLYDENSRRKTAYEIDAYYHAYPFASVRYAYFNAWQAGTRSQKY